MFGRLLRVTGTVLVMTVAFVTPVLATSAPASADTVIDGCTIVSNPTPTNFTNCPGANFALARLSEVDLSYANLSSAVLLGADLSNANLSSANLAGVSTVGCAAVEAHLDCFGAILDGANLTDANLTNASMATCETVDTLLGPRTGCDASDLVGADLTDADVSGATFSGAPAADLDQANLSGVNLTNFNLTDVLLTGANLTGATLTGANLTGTVLVPSDQTVTATSAAGAVVTWPTPPSLPGTTSGACNPPSGSTFPINFPGPSSTTVTCQVLDSFGDVATGQFFVSVEPVTVNETISTSANPSRMGQPVSYIATLSPNPGGGTVAFTDNGVPIAGCSAVPVSGGSATCSTTPGTTGTHNLETFYSGTGVFGGASSGTFTQVVSEVPCPSLAGCNLSQLNLSDAQLQDTDLQGANLMRANLSDANLAYANLQGANFNGANLTGAFLLYPSVSADTNFSGVTWANTTCPDGTNSDNDGGSCVGNL